jgi:NTP pyrophosphatase (non-canonical NTP hydrolase)
MMRDFETFDDFQDAIEDWAFERGLIEQSTVEAQLLKLVEETAELITAIRKRDRLATQDSIGDIQTVLAVICVKLDCYLSVCASHAYNEIKDRKGRMVDGQFVKEVAE